MSSPFDGCWERIRRAKAHRESIRNLWAEVCEDNPYDLVAEVNDDGTGVVRVVQSRPLPPQIPLDLGEALYQLRAALDGAIFAGICIEKRTDSPANAHKLEFPIFKRPDLFDAAQKENRKFPFQDEGRLQLLESVQPYQNKPVGPFMLPSVNQALWWIHDWSRIDRHRRLHVIATWTHGGPVSFRDLPDGVILPAVAIAPGTPLKNESELASFVLEGGLPGMNLYPYVKLLADVAVDEIPGGEPGVVVPLYLRLSSMLGAAWWSIKKLSETFGHDAPPDVP